MKRLLCLLAAILVTGCAGADIPAWSTAGFQHLESYKKAFLEGRDTAAEFHYRRAEEAIKRSGNIDILARARLTRFALHVAALKPFVEQEYLELERLKPLPETHNYFLFLRGDFQRLDPALLPEQYWEVSQGLRSGNIRETESAIRNIENPLSRLIATGLAVRQGYYNEAILKMAVATASENGWQKVLLVYLETKRQYYEQRNDPEKALGIKHWLRVIK